MPWKVRSLMSERLKFCKLAEQGLSITALCKYFEISRQTGYKWLRRYKSGGLAALEDKSRRPHTVRNKTSSATVQAIVEVRKKYAYWGARKLSAILRRERPDIVVPSLSTINRILRDEGLLKRREASVDLSTGSFERTVANELWQMDLKGPIQLQDGSTAYLSGLIDDYSRYVLDIRALPTRHASGVIASWLSAVKTYGLPKSVLTDHGVQFRAVDEQTSAFSILLLACGVGHTQGRVKHPQTQGKIERTWRTINTECLRGKQFGSLHRLQSQLDTWRDHYNHYRPHQSLGDAVPASRYVKSERPYIEPDRYQRIGERDSEYRMVNGRGRFSLGGKRYLAGWGLSGWIVEIRPIGSGIWRVYFRGHFIREIALTNV